MCTPKEYIIKFGSMDRIVGSLTSESKKNVSWTLRHSPYAANIQNILILDGTPISLAVCELICEYAGPMGPLDRFVRLELFIDNALTHDSKDHKADYKQLSNIKSNVHDIGLNLLNVTKLPLLITRLYCNVFNTLMPIRIVKNKKWREQWCSMCDKMVWYKPNSYTLEYCSGCMGWYDMEFGKYSPAPFEQPTVCIELPSEAFLAYSKSNPDDFKMRVRDIFHKIKGLR